MAALFPHWLFSAGEVLNSSALQTCWGRGWCSHPAACPRERKEELETSRVCVAYQGAVSLFEESVRWSCLSESCQHRSLFIFLICLCIYSTFYIFHTRTDGEGRMCPTACLLSPAILAGLIKDINSTSPSSALLRAVWLQQDCRSLCSGNGFDRNHKNLHSCLPLSRLL